MANKVLELDNIGTVKLFKRRGSSHIRISFGRDGAVRVTLPYWVPYKAGIDFVKTKQDWIAKHRPNHQNLLSDGDRIGKAHRLRFKPRVQSGGCRVKIVHNVITVSHPKDKDPYGSEVQKAAERGALKALKIEADKLLPQRLETLANKHGFSYKNVSTKRLSSRWGSCSHQKDIILNTYLMQLDWELIDYVIIHELVHTEHLNHSAGFWKRFEEVLPDARARRKLLKTHHTVITPTN